MNESALEPLLGALDDPSLVFDGDGRLRYWNRPAARATGYADDELASMALAELFDGGGAERIASVAAGATGADPIEVEASVVTADGERLPCEFEAVRLTDGDGATLALCRFDVVEGAAGGARRAILDRMTDAFFAVDDEWYLTYVNERASSVLSEAMGRDLDADELKGLHLWEEIPEAVDTAFYEHYHEAMATQEPVSFEAEYGPLDTWFEVRAYPSETGLSVYFRDVTRNRRRREELETRERVLREIYDVISDGDRSFAEQVDELMSLGRGVLGTDYATLSRIHGDEYVFEMVQAPDDGVQPGDVVSLSATNCERTVIAESTLVAGNVARDAPDLAERASSAGWEIACYLGAPISVADRVYGTFCFYDDQPREDGFTEWEVTLVDLMSRWVSYELERQRVNERLQRRNDQLEEFASVVSHDLRNPLNVLEGSLALAEETGDPEQFDRCRRAVDRMAELIDDLLSLANAGRMIDETEPVDLTDLVERCWENVATAEAVLRVNAGRTVRADESRVRQLIENLVRNAIEHAGEAVTVTVGDLDDGFYVADDGPGIDEDDRERVFESGYSTTDDGTGFGLSIVERVADAHGWDVRVTEGVDGGARFEITGVEFA